MQLGQGKLKTDIKPEWVRFDDNAWHHVKVTRKSGEVSHLSHQEDQSDYKKKKNTLPPP